MKIKLEKRDHLYLLDFILTAEEANALKDGFILHEDLNIFENNVQINIRKKISGEEDEG